MDNKLHIQYYFAMELVRGINLCGDTTCFWFLLTPLDQSQKPEKLSLKMAPLATGILFPNFK